MIGLIIDATNHRYLNDRCINVLSCPRWSFIEECVEDCYIKSPLSLSLVFFLNRFELQQLFHFKCTAASPSSRLGGKVCIIPYL